MRKIVYLLIIIYSSFNLKSQCFQIQSILVDACDGSNEGRNEMVTFQVGATALNVSNLTVNWPNNNWLGITQNATTASAVVTINSTINGCGLLKEPIGGILPANSKVLLVTSTAFNPNAQSFASLTDTLIIIFQTAGNTAGHFANYQSGGGTRTLSMSFSSPASCSDAVTYNRAQLVNQAGIVGGQDGATVEFNPAGVASYVNYGCQAPYLPFGVDAGPNKAVCGNATQTFTAIPTGNYNTVNWTIGAGANGSFSPTNSLTTTYTPSVLDNGTIKLYCTITKTCSSQSTSIKDSVLLTITPSPTVSLNTNSLVICSGQTATVQASSSTATTYTWSNGQTGNTLSTTNSGNYTVTASNACGSANATVSVSISGTTPTIQVTASTNSICAGQTSTLSLTASAGNYSWSNGSINTNTITVNQAGVYTATVSNTCGSTVASVSVSALVSPTVSISSSATNICNGQSATLTAVSNANNFVWSNGASTNSTSVSNAGVQTVTVINTCGISTASVNVSQSSLPILNLTSSSFTICPNQTATLTVTGGSEPYNWSNSSNTGSVVSTNGGTVSVSSTNVCGTVSQSIVVSVVNITANISANPVVGIGPLTVNFTNNSVGATSYDWDFGNGQTSTSQNAPSQTYTEPGTYTITLLVGNGVCTNNASITVEVLADAPTLYIPNAFTPNNDKVNDVFFVKGTNIKEFSMIIFDRWGLEMFSSSDINQGWDGKINGTMTSDGTYFYLVKALGTDKVEINKQGTVTLFK